GNTNPTFDIDPDPDIKTLVPVDITDYRVDVANQTSNGLDKRFGAGQVNVYNSYHILAGGEQNSVEDGGTTIANTGFDYDPAFGGLNSSNATATYSFTTGAIGGQKLKAALVWNLDALTTSTDNLYDLDLELIDVTAGNVVVASSSSTIDNTENIWFDLAIDHAYQLKVIRGSGQAAFEWDYALAWQLVVPGVTVVETDSTTMTAEDGAADTFTVVLDSPPAGDVTINLASSDTGEGTVSPASLTFTSANWSTLQTVTVTGIDDAVDDGDKNYSIDFAVSSVDANYNGMTLPVVSVSNIDDDATFSFTDQIDVALSTLTYSSSIVVNGLINAASISITGGEYSINGGAYTLAAGTVNNGDNVTLRTISPATGLTTADTVVTIGSVSDAFSVTTEVDIDGDGVGNTMDDDDDNDGLTDMEEAILGTNPLLFDSDNDGVNDNVDAFPLDSSETIDSDGDGVGDNTDIFPNDATETTDTDGDGVGDNSDNCTLTANANQLNTDGDTQGDVCDSDDDNDGLSDVEEGVLGTSPLLADTDNDGTNDNVDAFPLDSSETIDSDGDGVGDNADIFPFDATETLDSDGDGIGDNADAFPDNIAASVDDDNDGLPDEWNADCDATCQDDSGLTLDVATDVATGTSTSSGGGGSLSLLWLLLPLFITAARRRVS
ncbi:MAG: thrombospondin type 3 repeat-containing protein, partial [Actinobacteria bacterium]|nr:thrombospondin type 3 repeat-containing protein [Actinomycetota bacterium]